MASVSSELRMPAVGRRWTTLAARAFGVLPPLLGAASVGGLAAANGGYFANTCAWASLALMWLVVLALLLRSQVYLGALGLVFAASLTLFVGWSALSVLWTSSVTLTMFDVQKLLVYVGLVAAALLVVERRTVPGLLAGVLAGIVVVCAYALATRLFPERFGGFDPVSGYRLTTPVGYWNALGIFAGIGIVLAAGFAARAVRPAWRAAAAAALPLLMETFFFTFSRGAWIALALGIVAACVLDPRRLQLIAVLLVLAPCSALSVVVADRSSALTTTTALLSDASREGHRLALWIVVLAAISAGIGYAFALLETRVRVPHLVRAVFAGVLVLAVLGLGAAVWIHEGSPRSLARRAYDSFRAPPQATNSNLAGRLLSLSSNGRIDLWRVAWHEFEAHPVDGAGAGTYQQAWYAHRPYASHALDAHGLYQQTLGELGAIGFVLLVAALVAPLVAAVRARRNPLVPVALGAYVAFLVHNGVDWDWQLTGVGGAGLLCAVALVVCAPRRRSRLELGLPVRIAAVTAALPLMSFAFVTVMANVPLGSAQAAADRGDWAASAAAASKARRWAPWSSEPLRLLGEAQLAQAKIGAARRSFRTAIAKDPRSWELRVDLALATTGADKRRALAAAELLDPRDATLRELVHTQLIRRGV